jgi:hypothetical protein
MIPEKLTDLIHRAIFDTISDKERGELKACLEKEPEARRLYDDMVKMAGLLKDCPEVEPPPNLKRRILNVVKTRKRVMLEEERRSGSREAKRETAVGDARGKRLVGRRMGLLVGGGVVAVAVILIIAFVNQSPSDRQARGTIGGAEKAAKQRVGQIGEADVIDVILEDPEFRQLLENDKVQDLVKSSEFQNLMSDTAFVSLLSNRAFVALLSDPAFIHLMSEPGLRRQFFDAIGRHLREHHDLPPGSDGP